MEVSGPEDDPFLAQLHRVQCPVCQQTMPAAHINSHLDRCLLLHPAGHAEPAPPRAKRRRPSESSALKQPATPTAAESSEGEAEEPDDGGETESRESYDAPPTPSGARLIPDFPVARPGSPGGKGAGQRPAAAAAGSASPRSWDEAEAPEEEEAAGDADGEDDAGRWDADAAAAFEAPGGRPHARAPAAEEVRQLLEGKPLADTMRPDALQDFVGQGRAVGPETLLRSLLEANEVPSIILWGPPGCGKVSASARPAAPPGPQARSSGVSRVKVSECGGCAGIGGPSRRAAQSRGPSCSGGGRSQVCSLQSGIVEFLLCCFRLLVAGGFFNRRVFLKT